MPDRSDKSRGDGADADREGFGDDQGTRVGSPTPGSEGDAERQPSHLSKEFSVSGTGDEESSRETGAGAEAAEGLHKARGGQPEDRTALQDVDTGRSRFDEATVERAGSEPIRREREHKSGYGGEGGAPKTSSDRREPLEPEGHAED